MEKIILFIHGWSEHGDVFHKLMHEITKDYGHKYYMVDIAEFISMDDTVSFFDLVEAMQDVWLRKNLPTSGELPFFNKESSWATPTHGHGRNHPFAR